MKLVQNRTKKRCFKIAYSAFFWLFFLFCLRRCFVRIFICLFFVVESWRLRSCTIFIKVVVADCVFCFSRSNIRNWNHSCQIDSIGQTATIGKKQKKKNNASPRFISSKTGAGDDVTCAVPKKQKRKKKTSFSGSRIFLCLLCRNFIAIFFSLSVFSYNYRK